MFVPLWLLVAVALTDFGLVLWTYLLASGRNPLPFPDRGSRIFSAPSPEAEDAVVALLARHGLRERLRFDCSGILRSSLWDGAIINCPPPDVLVKLDAAGASIGMVAEDPVSEANAATAFLRSRGFDARVVLDAEPELPVAFEAYLVEAELLGVPDLPAGGSPKRRPRFVFSALVDETILRLRGAGRARQLGSRRRPPLDPDVLQDLVDPLEDPGLLLGRQAGVPLHLRPGDSVVHRRLLEGALREVGPAKAVRASIEPGKTSTVSVKSRIARSLSPSPRAS